MDTPRISKLIRPFDPSDADAEENYDAVARRVNRVRSRRAVVSHELAELERQFVENDLSVGSGPRRGQPLNRKGRRERLDRLLDLGVENRQLNAEERFASTALDHMNEALDRWARQTYGA